jgi:hypothetical protein
MWASIADVAVVVGVIALVLWIAFLGSILLLELAPTSGRSGDGRSTRRPADVGVDLGRLPALEA